MPQKAWIAKREREYAHTKGGLLEAGQPEFVAQQITARVVNKERAQHGESVSASASSRNRGLNRRSATTKAQHEAALAR
jgi:hypothetical protein